MFIKGIPKKVFLLFFGDIFFIAVSYFLALYIRGVREVLFDDLFFLHYIVIALINVFMFYLFDLYDFSIQFSNLKYLFRFLISVLLSFLIVSTVFYFVGYLNAGRGVLLIKTFFIIILCYGWRILFEKVFSSYILKVKNLLIVGAGSSGKFLYNAIKNDPLINVKFFIDDDYKKVGKSNSPLVIGGCERLVDDNFMKDIDEVVVAIKGIKSEQLLRCILACKAKNIEVKDMPTFYELYFNKIPVKYIDDFWIVANPMLGMKKTVYNSKLKSVLDKVFAVIMLLCSLPILLISMFLIWLEDGLPVIFRQQRVGKDGKLFTSYKLRTMRKGTENKREKAGEKDDPRITNVGRFLRKLRIDEIPQLLNVLKDDMSLIGPRALIEEEVKIFEKEIPYFGLRHTVKPGITGWAQVNYKHGAKVEDGFEKLQYDLYYIKNLSPAIDFYILLKTIKVVLFGKGAR